MARSIPVGGIHISITGNSVDFRKAVKSARSEIWKLKQAFAPLTGIARNAGIAMAAAGVAAAAMGKNLAEGIDKLAKLSTSLHTTVADLQAFEMAAGLQGVDFTKATNGLKKLQVVVGQISSGRAYSEVTEEWDKLGLKIEDIINLPVVEQFQRITQAIREMVPAGEQAATASAFFGTRNATDVMRMTAETFDQSREALERYGITLSQTAARDTEAMNDAMLVLSLIFKNFARNIVAEHAPAVKRWVQEIQAGLVPGGRFRSMLERLATAFRIAATATIEFGDILSRLITKERAQAVALAAIVLAGTKLTLMLGGALIALGKFTAAMITGQSIASGFAVTLGVLQGGVFGLIATMAALGLAVAGGVALHRTLTAEFGAAATAGQSAEGVVQSLSDKYDALKAAMDGVTGASNDMTAAARKSLEMQIAQSRLKATFEEAGVMMSPAFQELTAKMERLRAERDALMAPGAVENAVAQSQGHMTAAQFIKGRRERVGAIDRDIAGHNQEQLAMLENVHAIRDAADEADAKLAAMGETVASKVAPEIENASDEMSDLAKVTRHAFDEMEGSFDRWFDRYRDGLADMGDLFDTFAKAALKHLVKLWAFQPLMGAIGGPMGLGMIPGFSGGGHHRGGARIVGEHGPELEITGPSRIYSNADTRRMLGGMGGMDINITVGGNRDDIRNQVISQVNEMAPRIADMAVAQVGVDAARPSMINERIRGAR